MCLSLSLKTLCTRLHVSYIYPVFFFPLINLKEKLVRERLFVAAITEKRTGTNLFCHNIKYT